MVFDYWFMFPISIAIATVAMASGVEGATFFTPLFLLGLGLPAEVAIGTGLITEVFGFGSGLMAYIKKRFIDYRLGRSLLMVTLPLALMGTYLSSLIPASILKALLGSGLLVLAYSFLRSSAQDYKQLDDQLATTDSQPETCLHTVEGEVICYTVCNRWEGRLISGIGALFIGMVSTGLGEMNGYYLLKRCRVPSKVAVATSVLVVSVTALTASIGHAVQFAQEGRDVLLLVSSLLIFTVPGVIIGGQLGPLVASRIPQKMLERSLAGLFILIALLTLGEVLLG